MRGGGHQGVTITRAGAATGRGGEWRERVDGTAPSIRLLMAQRRRSAAITMCDGSERRDGDVDRVPGGDNTGLNTLKRVGELIAIAGLTSVVSTLLK